jgi:hypothetical protein
MHHNSVKHRFALDAAGGHMQPVIASLRGASYQCTGLKILDYEAAHGRRPPDVPARLPAAIAHQPAGPIAKAGGLQAAHRNPTLADAEPHHQPPLPQCSELGRCSSANRLQRDTVGEFPGLLAGCGLAPVRG